MAVGFMLQVQACIQAILTLKLPQIFPPTGTNTPGCTTEVIRKSYWIGVRGESGRLNVCMELSSWILFLQNGVPESRGCCHPAEQLHARDKGKSRVCSTSRMQNPAQLPPEPQDNTTGKPPLPPSWAQTLPKGRDLVSAAPVTWGTHGRGAAPTAPSFPG